MAKKSMEKHLTSTAAREVELNCTETALHPHREVWGTFSITGPCGGEGQHWALTASPTAPSRAPHTHTGTHNAHSDTLRKSTGAC